MRTFGSSGWLGSRTKTLACVCLFAVRATYLFVHSPQMCSLVIFFGRPQKTHVFREGGMLLQTIPKGVAGTTKGYYKPSLSRCKNTRFFNAEAGYWQYPPNCTNNFNLLDKTGMSSNFALAEAIAEVTDARPRHLWLMLTSRDVWKETRQAARPPFDF